MNLSSEFSQDFEGSGDSDNSHRLAAMARQRGARNRQAEQEKSELTACQQCGSQWFAEMTFNQYQADAYGTLPGADLTIVNLMPMPIRICLCGHPVAPNLGGGVAGGRTPNQNLVSFQGSLEAAVNFLAGQSNPSAAAEKQDSVSPAAKTVITKVVSQALEGLDYVPKSEMTALQSRLIRLEEQLAAGPGKHKGLKGKEPNPGEAVV